MKPFLKRVNFDGLAFVELAGEADGFYTLDVGTGGQRFRLVKLTAKHLFDLAAMLSTVEPVRETIQSVALLLAPQIAETGHPFPQPTSEPSTEPDGEKPSE